MDEPSAPPAELPPLRIGRRLAAIAAGFFTIFVLTLATDGLLRGLGVFPTEGTMSDGLFALAAAHRLVASVAGAWLTARIAPDRPLRHALGLGVIGTVLGLIATLAHWNAGPEFCPKWCGLVLVVIAIPTAALGGFLGTPRESGPSRRA